MNGGTERSRLQTQITCELNLNILSVHMNCVKLKTEKKNSNSYSNNRIQPASNWLDVHNVLKVGKAVHLKVKDQTAIGGSSLTIYPCIVCLTENFAQANT